MAKARNGEGTIKPRKLADGRTVYDAWCSVKDPLTGKSGRKSKRGHPSEAAAVEWIQSQRAAARRTPASMTLDDLAEMFWAAETVKGTTASHWRSWYALDIQHYLGSMPVAGILPMHLDQWVLKIRAKLHKGKPRAPTTLVNRVTVLSAILDYGVVNRFIDADWTKASGGIRKLREDAQNFTADKRAEGKELWTVQQFLDFLEQETEPSYRALWCFLAATGARRGTALGLRWSDVNFERKRIVALTNRTVTPDGVMETTQKGGRRIIIHLDELLEGVLLSQRERQEKDKARGPWEDHDVVFDRPILKKSLNGKVFSPGIPMNPGTVTERFSRLARNAGLPPASPHDLRHLWGTMAKNLGATRDAVADQLGHRSVLVTNLYDHSEEESRELAASMARVMLQAA